MYYGKIVYTYIYYGKNIYIYIYLMEKIYIYYGIVNILAGTRKSFEVTKALLRYGYQPFVSSTVYCRTVEGAVIGWAFFSPACPISTSPSLSVKLSQRCFIRLVSERFGSR